MRHVISGWTNRSRPAYGPGSTIAERNRHRTSIVIDEMLGTMIAAGYLADTARALLRVTVIGVITLIALAIIARAIHWSSDRFFTGYRRVEHRRRERMARARERARSSRHRAA